MMTLICDFVADRGRLAVDLQIAAVVLREQLRERQRFQRRSARPELAVTDRRLQPFGFAGRFGLALDPPIQLAIEAEPIVLSLPLKVEIPRVLALRPALASARADFRTPSFLRGFSAIDRTLCRRTAAGGPARLCVPELGRRAGRQVTTARSCSRSACGRLPACAPSSR